MEDSDFCASRWKKTSLQGCRLMRARLSEAALQDFTAQDCDFDGVNFFRTPLSGIDFSRCTLEGIQAAGQELRGMMVSERQAAGLARLLGIVIRED